MNTFRLSLTFPELSVRVTCTVKGISVLDKIRSFDSIVKVNEFLKIDISEKMESVRLDIHMIVKIFVQLLTLAVRTYGWSTSVNSVILFVI